MKISRFEKNVSRDSLKQILISCSGYIPFLLFSLCFVATTMKVPIIGEGITVIVLIFIAKLRYILVILCLVLGLLPLVYIARKKRLFKLSNTLLLVTLVGCTLLLPFVLFYLCYGLTSVSTSLGLETEWLTGIMGLILLMIGWGLTSRSRKCNFIGILTLFIFDSFIAVLLMKPFSHSIAVVLMLATVLTLYFLEIFVLAKQREEITP